MPVLDSLASAFTAPKRSSVRFEISLDGGMVKKMDIAEFKSLPIGEKTSLLIGGKVRCFRGDEEIKVNDGLKES